MNRLNYGLLCEDKSHYVFITTFLALFARQYNVEIDLNKDFFSRFKASNSKEVLKKFPGAAIIGFRDYHLDLFVIGIDYDDRDRDKFSIEIDRLYAQLYSLFSHKSIIMFPVQAIEHWLLYIQYHISHPKSTKNISFEQIPRKEAKIQIYGLKYVFDNQELIRDLVNKMDINWLISRSESFRRFHYDLKKFFI